MTGQRGISSSPDAFVGVLVGAFVGALVGSAVGTPVGAGVGSDSAHPQTLLIKAGRNVQKFIGMIPPCPASSSGPHSTAGWPINAKIAEGFVTHLPSPQGLHLSSS